MYPAGACLVLKHEAVHCLEVVVFVNLIYLSTIFFKNMVVSCMYLSYNTLQLSCNSIILLNKDCLYNVFQIKGDVTNEKRISTLAGNGR